VPIVKIRDQTLKFFQGGIKIIKKQDWMRSVRKKARKNFSFRLFILKIMIFMVNITIKHLGLFHKLCVDNDILYNKSLFFNRKLNR